MDTLLELQTKGKDISNNPIPCYDELFITRRKKYEGRVATKIRTWHLKDNPIIKFYDKDDPSRFTMCRVSDHKHFIGPGEAFDKLGDQLLPGFTRDEVVEFYFKTLGFEKEINEHGFVAIELEIL